MSDSDLPWEWAEFDRLNPSIRERFTAITLELIAAGCRAYSARDVVHRIRLDWAGCPINNNWSPYYARQFIERFPEYDYIFELRASQAERYPPDPRQLSLGL